MSIRFENLDISGLVEALQPVRLWSDQKYCHLCLKSYIFKVLVRQIIVWLRFFSNGRTSLALLLSPLYFQNFESAKHFTKFRSFFANLTFRSLQNLDCAKCFANVRFPKSGVCEIFCKVQIFSAKPQSKCIQNTAESHM